MENLVIIGCSETAERILFFCKKYKLYNVLGFAIDREYIQFDTFQGYPVWPIDELHLHMDVHSDKIFVALFWNHLNGDRRRLYEKLANSGFHFANIISPNSSVRGDIGNNCWIMDSVTVQEYASIGDNVICADMAFIGNKTDIQSHAFIGAKSTIMGGCKIGKQTFVGINATIFDDTIIGDKCIVGACTIVKRNLPSCSVCRINNIDNIIKQYSEDIIESKWVAGHNVRTS